MAKNPLRTLALSAFPTYKGRKISANYSGRVTFSDTNWGGGSRNRYVCLDLAKGLKRGLSVPAPWVNPVEGVTAPIPEGMVVAEHTIFCGKDCGVTLYFPTSAAALGPATLPAGA